MNLIPNQSKYYTDGIDLYSLKRHTVYQKDEFKKHTGWRLTYNYKWRFYIKDKYRGNDGNKKFFYKDELKNYI